MRFSRYPRRKPDDFARTPRRIAAAKRAVQREKDDVPLFPELVTHHTAEARLDALEEHRDAWLDGQRQWRADRWREARRQLRGLPPIRQRGLRLYWQRGMMPGDPTYLLGLIREARTRTGCFWHRLAHLRRIALVGAGRLPRELVFNAAAARAKTALTNREVSAVSATVTTQTANR